MSQDIGDTRTCECRFGCCSGGGVDDSDAEILDHEDEAGCELSSDDG